MHQMLRLKNTKILTLFIAIGALVAVMVPAPVMAVTTAPNCDQQTADARDRCIQNHTQSEIRRQCSGLSEQGAEACAERVQQDINGTTSGSSSQGNFGADCKAKDVNKDNCGIVAYIVQAINFLSAMVGIVIVLVIVIRGIQYTASGDDPQMVSKAKAGIRDAVLALVYFLVLFAFLQWLIPGGIF